MLEGIYGLGSIEGEDREIMLSVDGDDGHFLAVVVNNGEGDEITNVVINSVEKLDAVEEVFGLAFAKLRAMLKVAALEAERVKLERFAQLGEELRKLGARWKDEREPGEWAPGKESETLTLLQQMIYTARSAGMSEREVNRASGASRGMIKRVMAKHSYQA